MSDGNGNGLRLDGTAELINSFGMIANRSTGIGTDRAKTTRVEIVRPPKLSRGQLCDLFEDGLINIALTLYPESAVKAWFTLSIPDNKEGDNLPGLILQYLDQLGDRDDQTELESMAEIYGAKEAFLIADILACQFGKSYILMGINDGQDFDRPVNKYGVNSIRWLQVYEDWELYPENLGVRTRSPNFYRINETNQLIHKSRILPFWGSRIYAKHSRQYLSDGVSLIQRMFDAYVEWLQGVKAGSEMLADYDLFTLGMKGLAQLLMNDQQTNTTKGQEAVMNRALAVDINKSVSRGLFYDMDNELPGSVTRSYQGADAIMKTLESRWVAITRMPRSKLFGELGSQGLTNNQGLAMRSEWALLVQNYGDRWVSNLSKLIKYVFLAKDSPSKGKLPESFDLKAVFDLQLTDTERMEYEKLAAERSQILVNIGSITKEEIRSGYRGSSFSSDLILDDDAEPETEDQPSEDPKNSNIEILDRGDTKDKLTDKEWEELATVTAKDFVEVAIDVSNQD